MNNLSSYCGLVDAKKGASDKDLPYLNNGPWQFPYVFFLIYRSSSVFNMVNEKFTL